MLSQLQPFNENFTELIKLYGQHNSLLDNNENNDLKDKNFLKLIKYINIYTNTIVDLVVSGKITSITAAALHQGQSKNKYFNRI